MKLPVVYKSAEEALSVIQSGHRLFIQGSAQTPLYLLRELAKRAPTLRDVELTFITVQGDIEVDKPQYADSFHINCMFVSESVRKAVNEGRADFIPVFLSDIPDLFRKEMHIDVA
ncbi:MAG: 4-hydroxybutyrate CoA-transferase, partial [Chitinophagaceae bacterium]|nr:4-hydroxybutyrate CoA-transferase [Chitinophagaceae bacterium]